jgi:hypothetical protein
MTEAKKSSFSPEQKASRWRGKSESIQAIQNASISGLPLLFVSSAKPALAHFAQA